MPKLSDTMTEGILLQWLVKVGDKVAAGDPLAEVEAENATIEMVAFDEGTIGALYVKEGTRGTPGEPLAVLLEEGEDLPEQPTPSVVAADDSSRAGDAEPVAPPLAGQGRIKASSLARKIAASENIDLSTIAGSGPGGRIVKSDLEKAADDSTDGAGRTPPGAQATRPGEAGSRPAGSDIQGPMRPIIGERSSATKAEIAHFYMHVELDAEPLMELIKQANIAAGEKSNKLTINDFALKAAASAAIAQPRVNASFGGDAIIQHASVDLSVAIAVDDGLVSPVIRSAQEKSLLEISLAVKDLTHRAKAKKLSPDELSGGTLTVSNLGGYGVDSFDAIIKPPQAAILSVGGIVNKPVVNQGGEVVPGMRMDVGISCDQRVVDAVVGAEYLAEFKKRIENPASILV